MSDTESTNKGKPKWPKRPRLWAPFRPEAIQNLKTRSGHSPLSVEIWARHGLFARSDTFPNAVSHPIPTPKAARSILKHVFTFKNTELVILAAEILSPTTTCTKTFNLKGPERKTGMDNSQMTQEILVAPRLRLTFDLICPDRESANIAIASAARKIKRGDHRIPFMGCSDWIAHLELPTNARPVDENHRIIWMAHDPEAQQFLPPFEIVGGVAIYPQNYFAAGEAEKAA